MEEFSCKQKIGLLQNTFKNWMCFFVALLPVVSCNNRSNYKSAESDDCVAHDKRQNHEILQTSELEYAGFNEDIMVICPMCQGYKQIQHYYTGEIIVCPACEGEGQVSEELLRQLQEADRIGREWADGVLNGNGGNSYYGRRTKDDIQAEIDQCEREISNMQLGLESLDESSTLYIYYSQELISLQYKLRQLQADLQNAE